MLTGVSRLNIMRMGLAHEVTDGGCQRLGGRNPYRAFVFWGLM